jgi:hypothetical protein
VELGHGGAFGNFTIWFWRFYARERDASLLKDLEALLRVWCLRLFDPTARGDALFFFYLRHSQGGLKGS